MDAWICVKCKETASSKCPDQRTVFPTDQIATVIGNVISVNTEITRDDQDAPGVAAELVIRHRFWLDRASGEHVKFMEREPVDIFFDRLEEIKKMPDVEERFRRAFCHHKWVLMEGDKCRLGCDHKNYEQWKQDQGEKVG